MRLAAAATILSLAAAAPLQASAPDAAALGVEPWSEAVVSVADLEDSSSWLIRDGGWQIVAEGAVERAELDFWRLPDRVTASYRRICAPAATTGCIRYIAFRNTAPQRPIRLAARPWDTGGIFSIMLRTDDAKAMFEAAIARGWWAESEPYRFSFGGSELTNVVVTGPHGVNYALYERETPPFGAFPVGRLSQAFNTMRMVRDQPASLAWYRDRLGFRVLFDAPFTDPEPRANNFSVPANLATSLVRRAAVAQPVMPGETGRIEVMQFEGFVGRDLAATASPPDLGIISVRYPVRELDEYRAVLEQRGVGIVYAGHGVEVGGLGMLELIAVRDPDGSLTEFYRAS